MPRTHLLRTVALGALLLAPAVPALSDPTPAGAMFRFQSGMGNAATGGPSGGSGPVDNGGATDVPAGGTNTTDPLSPEQNFNLGVRYSESGNAIQAGSPVTTGFVSVDGGTAPYTMSATGLPAGISLDCSDSDCYSGIVSGTPAAAGPYDATLRVQDVNGNVGRKLVSVYVGNKAGGKAKAFATPLKLFVNQPYYGPGATYQPLGDDGNSVVWSLAPDSAPLPPGISIDASQHAFNGSTIFDTGNATPTGGAQSYPGIVLRATPVSGDPVDTDPVTYDVQGPTVVADASPRQVAILPGATFGGNDAFQGVVTYGNQQSKDFSLPQDSVVELVKDSGDMPDGMSWNDGQLTFQGTPTVPGQTGTWHLKATVNQAEAVSPSFTLTIKNELNPVLTVSTCTDVPAMTPPFGGPTIPAHTECNDRIAQPGNSVDVPNGDPFTGRITVYGADASTCTGTASGLPQGLRLGSDLSISGTANSVQSTQASFNVSCAGKTKTLGPFSMEIQQYPAWMPNAIGTTIPYAEMHGNFCNSIFEKQDHGPYSNVSATNIPDYMTLSSDGTVCPNRAMLQPEYNGLSQFQMGTLSLTDGGGVTRTKPVRFFSRLEDH